MKTLVWLTQARADLDAIVEYFAASDARVGLTLLERIDRAAKSLARIDSGRPGRVAGTREKSIVRTNRILVYEVRENTVMILRVIHSARDWPARKWPKD